METVSLVTIVLAVYGALLSTTLAAYKFFENWKRLKVKLSYALIPDGIGSAQKVLLLSSTNLGKRPITLTSYGLALPNKKNCYFKNESPQNFPCTISDGESCTVFSDLKKMSEFLIQEGYKSSVQVKGYFGDASGKVHYGKKFKLSLS